MDASPEASRDNAQRHEREAPNQKYIVETVQSLQRGKVLEQGGHLLVFQLIFMEEVHDADAKGQREEGIAQKSQGDVEGKPIGLKSRGKLSPAHTKGKCC